MTHGSVQQQLIFIEKSEPGGCKKLNSRLSTALLTTALTALETTLESNIHGALSTAGNTKSTQRQLTGQV
jgi:hypothetical protein